MDTLLEWSDELVLDRAYAYFLPQTPISSLKEYANASYSSESLSSLSSPLSSAYESAWARDNIKRQSISILLIAGIGAAILYYIFCAFSYYLIFDRRLEHHPRFLKHQIRMEIASSMWAIPTIDVLTLPWFLAEVRGHSLLYKDVHEYGYAWLGISFLAYMFFNDFMIYWIHRLEHHPRIYKYIHKPHHKWISAFYSFRVARADGSSYTLGGTCFPPFGRIRSESALPRYLYLVLFVLVQVWTIFIHDGDMITGHWTERFINSPAHHTLHHMYFTCNYGQYFTWADKKFDSHRDPQPDLDPIHDALRVMREKGLVDADGNPIPQKKKDQ